MKLMMMVTTLLLLKIVQHYTTPVFRPGKTSYIFLPDVGLLLFFLHFFFAVTKQPMSSTCHKHHPNSLQSSQYLPTISPLLSFSVAPIKLTFYA